MPSWVNDNFNDQMIMMMMMTNRDSFESGNTFAGSVVSPCSSTAFPKSKLFMLFRLRDSDLCCLLQLCHLRHSILTFGTSGGFTALRKTSSP